jgi:hypothetical protein
LFAYKSKELYIYKSDNSITSITIPIEQLVRAIYVNKDNEIIVIFWDNTVYKVENNTLINTDIVYDYNWPWLASLVSDFKGVLRANSVSNLYIN